MMFLGPLLKKAVIKSLILICLAKHFIYVAIDIYNSLKKKSKSKVLVSLLSIRISFLKTSNGDVPVNFH